MKKFLLVCLTTLLSVASWADTFEEDGIYYEIEDDTSVSVTSNPSGYSGVVTIPETVTHDGNTYAVTSIGGSAFNKSTVTEVTIPDNVTTIGTSSFASCTSMTTINISPTGKLQSTNLWAFQDDVITEIVLPESFSSIGMNSLNGCKNLMTIYSYNPTPPSVGTNGLKSVPTDCTVYVPAVGYDDYVNHSTWKKYNIVAMSVGSGDGVKFEDGGISYLVTSEDEFTVEVTYGGESAISGTESYTGNMTIPEKVTYDNATYTVVGIGEYAFYNCTIEGIILPSSVSYISSYAFANCEKLASIDVSNVCSIDSYAFRNCTAMSSITFGKGLEVASKHMLSGCTSLVELTIPEGVNEVQDYAFEGCTSLTKITIASTADCTLGQYILNGCSSLETVILGDGVKTIGSYAFYQASLKNITMNGVTSIGSNAFGWCGLEEVTLPSSLTSIGVDAFEGATSLKKVTIKSGLTSLSNSVFYGCSSLTDVEIEEGLTSIGDQVFQNCTSLVNVSLPSTLTQLGTQVFRFCYALEEISLPNGITTIPEMTFHCCSALAKVNMPSSLTFIGEMAFYQCYPLTDIEIPEGVTSIDTYAFAYSGLTELTLPSSLVTISSYVFYKCASLTNVTFQSSLTTIGEYAFAECSVLDNFELPSSLTSIGKYAFSKCYALTEVTIPTKVTSIPEGTFYYCTALEKINLHDAITELGTGCLEYCEALIDITLPTSLTTLADQVFAYCESLKEITIPSGVTSISDYLFYDCAALENVTLHEGITAINYSSFSLCVALTTIEIPAKVETIGDHVFHGCTNLAQVFSYNTTPPTCGTDVFTDVDVENCVLVVPTESKELYETADVWKDFGNILGANEPIVYTLEPSCVTKETAMLNGSIVLTESADEVVEYGFEWWQDEDNKVVVECEGDINDINYLIENLSADNTYTYQIYAKTASEIYYGKEKTISTTDRHADFYSDGLFYIYTGDVLTCVVTYETESYNTYSGDITVPETTMHNGEAYTVVGVGDSAFRECVDLSSISLSNTILSISTWAFYNCASLTEVTIPDAVTEVGNQAFNGCTAMMSVTIGSGVETIGTRAFNCPNLVELTSLNITPPTCGTSVFEDVDKSACILYVPEGTVKAYSEASTWEDFYNLVEMIEFAVITYEATNITETTATLNGKASDSYLEPNAITSKGFVYWSSDPNVVEVIIISDEDVEMSYTLSSLTPETTYTYRAFAVTDSGTTYGEDVEFTTLEDTTTGINGISLDNENVEGIYSTSGQKLNSTVKGVNIIRYNDGSVKKIYVK